MSLSFVTGCILLSLLHISHGYLPLPSPLIPLDTRAGEAKLFESIYKSDAFLLLQHFTTQINGAFCGVASSVMLLNALEVPRPINSEPGLDTNPFYNYYDQFNVFNNDTEIIVPQATVAKQGMTLDQLSAFLASHPMVGSLGRHSKAMTGGLDEFRNLIQPGLPIRNIHF